MRAKTTTSVINYEDFLKVSMKVCLFVCDLDELTF